MAWKWYREQPTFPGICDKLPKVPNGYNRLFDAWHECDLRDMIRRDRNHPAVIMWSIGNEILEQGLKDGYYLFQSHWTGVEENPMVHLLPHWNWEGREGEPIPAYTYTIAAGGEDTSFVTVPVVDAAGGPCSVADNPIRFKIDGPGEIAAVGNGNPATLPGRPAKSLQRPGPRHPPRNQ